MILPKSHSLWVRWYLKPGHFDSGALFFFLPLVASEPNLAEDE